MLNRILGALVVILVWLAPTSAGAQDVVVGMNLVSPQHSTVEEQDAMLAALKSHGVHAIRMWLKNDDKSIDLARRAYAQGIKIDWNAELQFKPDAPLRSKEDQQEYHVWKSAPFSEADPEAFRAYAEPILQKLEKAGVVLAGIELGNEFNTASYNADFELPGEGKVLNFEDLHHGREGLQIARGFVQYVKLLAVLKDLRDHTSLNQHTPIISGGLTYGREEGQQPDMKKLREDGVSLNATIQFLKANGADRLVDAYGVHVYPWNDGPGQSGPAKVRRERLDKFDLAECGSDSKGGKPCWITEWGFKYGSQSCPPPDEADHVTLVREMLSDYRPYVAAGRVTGLFYFAWNTDPWQKAVGGPWSVDRCNGPTQSGLMSLGASSLR